jgi:hypothetical protein
MQTRKDKLSRKKNWMPPEGGISFVAQSNTGHAQDAAKRAPMSANRTALLGNELTSDALTHGAPGRVSQTRADAMATTERQAASHPHPLHRKS